MIHVERSPEPFDPQLRHRIQAARDRLRAEMAALGRQQRVRFDEKIWLFCRPALQQLFHHKCAFCESLVERGVIEHFLPKSLYPLKVYDWTNLYLACDYCNMNKRETSPLDSDEKTPWLLDPCVDYPEQLLSFFEDGTVAARTDTSKSEQRRADKTIATLGLNRESLVRQRLQSMGRVEALAKSALAKEPISDEKSLAQFLDSHAPGANEPYIAACRAVVLRVAGKKDLKKPTPLRAAKTSSKGELRTTSIHKIEIRGFRLAKDIELDIPIENTEGTSDSENETPARGASWLVLLGENGTAKTTVLQAVAFALMGEKYLRRWPSNPLTRDGNQSPRKGYIRVHLSTDPKPIEVVFDASGPRFTSGHLGARTLVRGYGAVRLTNTKATRTHPVQWVDNLFDPRTNLKDPNKWAMTLDAKSLDAFGYATKDLLGLRGNALVSVNRNGLQIQMPDGTHPYEELSVGYQHMISLVADLTAAARQSGVTDPANASGIVLLDELGTHLHPRWRMEVVTKLRRAFRGMQFLATTHEPLCLRGLYSGETVLLERDDQGVKAIADLPDPMTLRVDQLLTSRLFGLHSTIDPKLDMRFQRYYALLGQREHKEAERIELEQLRGQLRQHTVLGYTRRDQMVYDIIDEYLANERSLDPTARKKLGEETRRKVAGLWSTASFAARRAQ